MSTFFTCEISDAELEKETDGALFPLPTTVFEEYMLLDDSARYPMDVFRRLRFVGGRLDVDAFRGAVERTVARHPLFSRRVEKIGKRYYWVASNGPIAFQAFRRDAVAGSADPDDSAFFADARPICLARETGLRTTVVWDDDSADVVFQSHHSVADGVGTGLFLRDVLCEYAALVGRAPVGAALAPVDRESLRERGRFGLTLKSYLLNYYYTTKSTLRFLFVNPRPIFPVERLDVDAPPKRSVFQELAGEKFDPAPDVRRRDDLIATALTVDETRRCVRAAKRDGATLNDLCVAGCCAAIDRLRNRLGFPICGIDRIAVPINMRDPKRPIGTACNVVTMAFLDLPARVRRDSARMLREISRRTNELKRRDQKYFLDLVLKTGRFLASAVGSDLSLFLKSSRCRATATLSNLGRTLLDVPLDRTDDGKIQIGELVLDSLDNFAPIRDNSVVSIAVSTYAERLHFDLRYDPDYLPRQDAARFLDDLRECCVSEFDAPNETN